MDNNYENVLNKKSDAEKSNLDRLVENGEVLSAVIQENAAAAGEGTERSAENLRSITQSNTEEFLRQGQQFGDQFRDAFGFGNVARFPWAEQSKRNFETATRCGTGLTRAFQDFSRSCLELGQAQLQRNVEGWQRLARVRTPQEFASVQTELFREGMQHLIEDSRTVTERSIRVAQDASAAFSNIAVQGSRA